MARFRHSPKEGKVSPSTEPNKFGSEKDPINWVTPNRKYVSVKAQHRKNDREPGATVIWRGYDLFFLNKWFYLQGCKVDVEWNLCMQVFVKDSPI